MRKYTIEEIMKDFENLSLTRKYFVIDKALNLILNKQAGTKEYAIALGMGYGLEDDDDGKFININVDDLQRIR